MTNENSTHIALTHLNKAFKVSFDELSAGLKTLGELTDKDAKLSDKAKTYFDSQFDDTKEALEILRRLNRELENQLWNNIKEKSNV